MIGTGGISACHLDAYRTAGWEVAALWNRTQSKAESRAAAYCPKARIAENWQEILDDPEIDVVDVTLHPEHRLPIMRAALAAGKHVLSQKPFVTDLDVGADLVKLAEDRGVKLAVNQNARWAPHMAFLRDAARSGHLGEIIAVHSAVHWDHGWIAGTPFEAIEDLLLYDFGVHWFDFIASVIGPRAETVFATASHARGQRAKTPLMGQALIRFDGGQASLVMDGSVPHGPRDTSFVAGTYGSAQTDGPDLGNQTVTLTTAEGVARPKLEGNWFNDGFRGAMGELLCAIEEDRTPSNGALENLDSLALVFAAVASRQSGREVAVGSVRKMVG